MPGGDGTGPMRQGPLTGGGFGPCGSGGGSRSAQDDFRGQRGGFGRRQGRRNRRGAPEWSGWRRARAWTQAPGNERDGLHREEKVLETELELLRARIAELEKSD